MRSVIDMIVILLCLEGLRFTLYDNEKNYPKLRVTNRHSFGFGFSICIFPFLQTADITFFHEPPSNQDIKPANLLNAQNYDPLSTAFRQTFSQCPNLTSLTLTGVFDSSLFWPSSQQSPNTLSNCWPNLQFFTVNCDPITPSGHWYFIGPSGDDPEQNLTSYSSTSQFDADPDQEDSPSSDDAEAFFDAEELARLAGETPICRFRTVPNPIHLNPFILAFANFAKHTASPSLRSACLISGFGTLDFIGNFQFEICFYTPNQPGEICDESENKKFPRLHLEVGEWVLDPEVLEALKEAGRSKWSTEELLVGFCELIFDREHGGIGARRINYG